MSRPARVLVKLRPSATLAAAERRANLRPLYEPRRAAARTGAAPLALAGESQWFLADLPDGGQAPWDLAHARVAEQLGVADSDVEFAEPDAIATEGFPDEDMGPPAAGQAAAVGADCTEKPQNAANGQVVGTPDGWHLDAGHSQLDAARNAVQFTPPRTRIAHLDTGYYARHVTRPKNLRQDLQRNFVDKDHDPGNAEDPDNDVFLLDNSGHGTGTIGILAGGAAPSLAGLVIGGAPEADVVPLRIADSVVLLHTSAFARALAYAVDVQCDVVSMSMGGLPSRAWREAVDRAYLDGIFMVTAAGNNFGGLPTRNIVYPARYGRVVSACGVMADGRPYAHLQNRTMEGNFGPDKVMAHALSAYTPNVPWALYGCPEGVRRNGGGTSSATPQIAAAAALWLERYKRDLPRDWRRVEAVRNALYRSAAPPPPAYARSQGVLRAHDALSVRPVLSLPQTKADSDSFAFLRVITGLGIAEPAPRELMFNLEIAQRLLLDRSLQEIVPDPDVDTLSEADHKRFMDALIEGKDTSRALRQHLLSRYPLLAGRPHAPARRGRAKPKAPSPRLLAFDRVPRLDSPAYRRLRAYAVDPSFATRLDTAAINEVTHEVRWELLAKGPSGEYLKVEDVDATGTRYEGVNLDDPLLLARDGWPASEGNPQFHQQMVYAVAMKTIEHFEAALGRPVLWHHRTNPKKPSDDSGFVGQLTIRPHALRQANAFYSPDAVALLFGYFESDDSADVADSVPGSRVYSCLSADIVAHETTHAILDGMHRRFNEPTNPDVLAFHEAFADIVSLLQHFTLREVLEHEISRTRGDMEAESMLGSLALQFGRATSGRGALRDAIGSLENGVWKRIPPDPRALETRLAPHSRGAILVAAVFDAFLAIYKARIADLIRLNTSGTGILPSGAIHPDLVRRVTEEAAKSATHVLNMCIRALDYLPPVDVTFFEYLRALITADSDLVSDDRHNYRVAFVEAFRRRGIFRSDLGEDASVSERTLSVETLRWRGIETLHVPQAVATGIIPRLKSFADTCLYLDSRRELFAKTRDQRKQLHASLKAVFEDSPGFAEELGLDPKLGSFEVHQLRPAMRVSPDGRHVPQVVVGLTQASPIDARLPVAAPGNQFRGGSTLVVDLAAPELKYCIVKRIGSATRLARTRRFVADTAQDPLRALLFSHGKREPFAALHALAEGGGD